MATQITNNQTVVTDALWQTYLPLIDNGSINDIVILAVHHAIIGDYGMNILCARFASVSHPLSAYHLAHMLLGISFKLRPW